MPSGWASEYKICASHQNFLCAFAPFSFNVGEGDGQRYHLWRLHSDEVRRPPSIPVRCTLSWIRAGCTCFLALACCEQHFWMTCTVTLWICRILLYQVLFFALFSWKAPRYILNMPVMRHERVRKKYHILVEGDGIPPPIKSFREMKFPQGKKKNLHGKMTVMHLFATV